jgi:hypothetical protein
MDRVWHKSSRCLIAGGFGVRAWRGEAAQFEAAAWFRVADDDVEVV